MTHSFTTPQFLGSFAFAHPWIQDDDTMQELHSQIKLSLLHFLVGFSNASCPLRFYQYSGDTASHYAAPTTLALSLLVTDRPAIVPEQCSVH